MIALEATQRLKLSPELRKLINRNKIASMRASVNHLPSKNGEPIGFSLELGSKQPD